MDKKKIEHFINRLIINKFTSERFDPSDILQDEGERGLDGIAIIINDKLITSMDEFNEENRKDELDVKFVFIQTKTSDSFSSSEIGNFTRATKSFFLASDKRQKTNQKIEDLIQIKDEIYRSSIKFIGNKAPVVGYDEKTGKYQFYNAETGAFQTSGKDNNLATQDALEGLVSYYRALTGAKPIYSYEQIELVAFPGEDKEAYEMTDAEGTAAAAITFDKANPKTIVLRSTAPLLEFLRLLIGGKEVDPQYYTLSEGSTVIELSTDYLDTLEAGDYEVKIESLNGYAVTKLSVEAVKKAPQTGDNMPVVMILGLMFVSGAALVTLKKRYNR